MTAITIVFQIEFFPFSNYSKYSKAFLPKTDFTYPKVYQIDEFGMELAFNNSRFGLFHSEQPFLQALNTYQRVRGGRQELFLKAALEYARQKDPSIKGLRLYNLKFNWDKYKKSRLMGEPLDPDSTFKREKLIEVLN